MSGHAARALDAACAARRAFFKARARVRACVFAPARARVLHRRLRRPPFYSRPGSFDAGAGASLAANGDPAAYSTMDLTMNSTLDLTMDLTMNSTLDLTMDLTIGRYGVPAGSASAPVPAMA